MGGLPWAAAGLLLLGPAAAWGLAGEDHAQANGDVLLRAWAGAHPGEALPEPWLRVLEHAAVATRHVALQPAPEHEEGVHAGEVWSFNTGLASPPPLTASCPIVRLPVQGLPASVVYGPNAAPLVSVGPGVHVVFTESALGLSAYAGVHASGQHAGANCASNSGWGSTVLGTGAFPWT